MSFYYKNGRKALDNGDFDEAFLLFVKGEENGDPKCIYGKIAAYANAHKNFSDFIPQLKDNINKIQEEADNGNVNACFILGRCYEMGLAVTCNIDTALSFYKKAAEGNDTDAMFNIGCIFMSQGKQEEAVAKYFMPAAMLGNIDAINAVEHYKKHKKSL